MRFAAVQFDIVWEDKGANHAIVERMIDEHGIEPGTFVLLPELGDTGFSFNLDRIVDERSMEWACRFARDRGIWLQPGFAERGPDGRGRNCAAVIDPHGEVRSIYRKVHPFSYGREIEHFTGGEELVIAAIGDEQSGIEVNVCPLICYDLRFPELWRLAVASRSLDGASGAVTSASSPAHRLTASPTHSGAEVFTIGASWPAARQHHWRSLLIARAIENQAYVVAVNRIGNDPTIKYVGGSIIISPTGEVLAEAGDAPAVLQAELDLEALRQWRRKFPALADIHRELLGEIPVRSGASRASQRGA